MQREIKKLNAYAVKNTGADEFDAKAHVGLPLCIEVYVANVNREAIEYLDVQICPQSLSVTVDFNSDDFDSPTMTTEQRLQALHLTFSKVVPFYLEQIINKGTVKCEVETQFVA